MKRILIATGIFPPDMGGPASYGNILAEKISGDFSVTVLTYSSKRKHPEDRNKSFKIVRVWRKTPQPFRHLSYFIKALNLAKKNDIIFALNAVSAGVPALMAAKILKKKFIVRIVGDYSWEMAINRKRTSLLMTDFQKTKRKGWIGILYRLQIWVCKNAVLVIVPSEFLFGVVKNWGVDENKIKIINNGVDFKPTSISREEARKKIGIPGNIIVSVGRLVAWKGFKMLIKIMPKLFEINQFFRLIIVGDGPDKKALESMIKNMGLQKKVFLVGKKFQSELALYLAAADIFILNSGYEGFSHQILEAMSCGVPVVTTGVGGNREVIHQGENGFMVKYNDEFNIIEAVRTLWQVLELRERFIEEGKKTAEYFSVDKMVEETKKVLNL